MYCDVILMMFSPVFITVTQPKNK